MGLVGGTLITSAYDFQHDGIFYKFNYDRFTVSVTNDGISSYKPEHVKYRGDVVIPATFTYEGTEYTVTGIDEAAFESCDSMTSITLPSTLKRIDRAAFFNCKQLTSIVIPDGVTEIGGRCFFNCTNLADITFPDHFINYTGYINLEGTFDGTAWFSNKPDGVVYAGRVAYKYKGTMPEGTSITLEDGTLGISPYAFNKCSTLVGITLPSTLTHIGEYAFYN